MWSRIFQMGAPVIAAVSLALPLSAQTLERVDADPVVAPVFARHWPDWTAS